MKQIYFVKMHCVNCGSESCTKRPIGSAITNEEGCIKEVSAITGQKFFHYMIEILPFLRSKDIEQFKEADSFIHTVEEMPAGERFR